MQQNQSYLIFIPRVLRCQNLMPTFTTMQLDRFRVWPKIWLSSASNS